MGSGFICNSDQSEMERGSEILRSSQACQGGLEAVKQPKKKNSQPGYYEAEARIEDSGYQRTEWKPFV